MPRRFEAFWPQAKVTAVLTRCADGNMSPRCFITSEGCTEKENPDLHSSSSTRLNMQFEGPTRRGGFIGQEIDLSIVDQESAYCSDHEDNTFVLHCSYVQFNVCQGINSFFQEYTALSRRDNGTIKGRIRVAVFLPIAGNNVAVAANPYDDSQAIAIYDYKVEMTAISGDEAATRM